MKILIRPLKVVFLTLLSYLIDVCLMPRLAVGGVVGSASFAAISVITVSYGRKAAFCSGAIIGILMETMLSSVPVLYLLSYPLISMLCAQWFADLTDRQRERRKLARAGREMPAITSRFGTIVVKPLLRALEGIRLFFRREENLNPYLRIPLFAFFSSLFMNVIFLIYGYVYDFGLNWVHITRAAVSILYTVALSLILTVPYRLFLGLIGRKRQRSMKRESEAV